MTIMPDIAVASSPIVPPVEDSVFKHSTIYTNPGSLGKEFEQDFFFPSDQPIDLGLELEFAHGGDISMSDSIRVADNTTDIGGLRLDMDFHGQVIHTAQPFDTPVISGWRIYKPQHWAARRF